MSTQTTTAASPVPGATSTVDVGAGLRALLRTRRDFSALFLRLTLGLVFFPHGAQKMLGWFGGPGFAGEMELLTGAVGIPALIAALVILIEFFGAIALVLGLLGRVAALGIASVMVGAALTVHLPFGFFMNWFGELPPGAEGFEYHLLVLAIALVIMVRGSGAFSLDRKLAGAGETEV